VAGKAQDHGEVTRRFHRPRFLTVAPSGRGFVVGGSATREAPRSGVSALLLVRGASLERTTGLEPATPTLAMLLRRIL